MINGLRSSVAWKLRRRVIYTTLLYCAVMVLYINVYMTTPTTAIHETLVAALLSLSSTVLLYWIIGATVEDTTKDFTTPGTMVTAKTIVGGFITKRTWELRRRVIFLTLIYCATLTAYISFGIEVHTKLHTTSVNGMIALSSTVLLYWIFGSAGEDIFKSLKAIKVSVESKKGN